MTKCENVRKTPLLHELNRPTRIQIPSITTTIAYGLSARWMSCGVQRGGGSLVMWFMEKEKTNCNRTGPRFIMDLDQEARRRETVKEKKMRLCFYFMKSVDLKKMIKKIWEKRWKISGTYSLCSSYTLVSNEWKN